MNNNKQLNKGDKMRKIAMIVGLVSVLATSANAYTWSQSNILGGYNYYSSGSGMLGYSQSNILGGYNYYWK